MASVEVFHQLHCLVPPLRPNPEPTDGKGYDTQVHVPRVLCKQEPDVSKIHGQGSGGA